MDFWGMPNPFSAENDYWPQLMTMVEGAQEPVRSALLQFINANRPTIIMMLQQKADKDHRTVLTAIASTLREKGIDVGDPPWA